MTLDDFKIQKKQVLVFFHVFLAATVISIVYCTEITGDGPRQPAYEFFNHEK